MFAIVLFFFSRFSEFYVKLTAIYLWHPVADVINDSYLYDARLWFFFLPDLPESRPTWAVKLVLRVLRTFTSFRKSLAQTFGCPQADMHLLGAFWSFALGNETEQGAFDASVWFLLGKFDVLKNFFWHSREIFVVWLISCLVVASAPVVCSSVTVEK